MKKGKVPKKGDMNLEKATKLARQNMKEKLKSGEACGYNLEQLGKFIGNMQKADNFIPNKRRRE